MPKYLPLLLLLTAVLTVFGPSCGFEFINYDDDINVYENSLVVDFSLDSLADIWAKPYKGLYIPLTYTCWALLAWLSKLLTSAANPRLLPGLFHAANIIVHGLATYLCFLILTRIIRNTWAAAAGALLFAVHPLQVEPVAWVTGLKDVLSGCLALFAVYLSLDFCENSRDRHEQHSFLKNKKYRSAMLSYCGALLVKPAAVVTPAIILIIGCFLNKRSAKELVVAFAPWILPAVPLVLITMNAQPETGLTFIPSLPQRFLVATDTLSFYVGKLFFPYQLGPDYGRTPQMILAGNWIYLTGILPYLAAASLLWKIRRPWLLTSAAIFTAALFPVLGFVSFDFQKFSTVADRYIYLAMPGPSFGLAWVLANRNNRLYRWISAFLLICLATSSIFQLRHWHDSITFNTHAIAVNPRSSTAYNNLGVACKAAGKPQSAIKAYKRSIALDPTFFDAYANIGNLYRESARPESALPYYKKALELNPNEPRIHAYIGKIFKEKGKLSEARNYFQNVVGINPQYAMAWAELGVIAMMEGERETARESLEKAVRLAPDFAEAFTNLGVIYSEEGRPDAAIAAYEKALKLDPGQPETYNNLGMLMLEQNNLGRAINLLHKGVELMPAQPMLHTNLGKAYLQQGEDIKAAVSFQKALEIDPRFAPAMTQLARIYLRQQKISQAFSLEKKARKLGYTDRQLTELLRPYESKLSGSGADDLNR